MTKRLMAGLPAILAALVLAPSSFAQVLITVTPTSSPNEIQTNHAAQTTDPSTQGAGILVTGSLLAVSSLTTTTLIIAYPATVTSAPAFCGGTTCANGLIPPEDPITIVGASGLFANVANPKLNTSLRRIEVDLPGSPASTPNSSSGFFRISGIRLDLNGLSGPVTATASLSNPANNYLLSNTAFTAINAVGAGIVTGGVAIGARTGQTNLGTATILTNRTVAKGTASLLITGGFAGAWRNRTQLSNSGTALNNATENSTQIQLTFANIPMGVTLTLSVNGNFATATSPVAEFCISPGCNGVTGTGIAGTTTVGSTSNTAVLEMVNPSLTSTPTVEVDISGISVSSTAAVTTPGVITVTASMAPFCTAATDSSGVPTLANGYPCFTETDVGPVIVVNIVPGSTTFLIPFALVQPPFDTGIAIANTSTDPGSLTFTFFPTYNDVTRGPTPFSFTTGSPPPPWLGIASNGTVLPGATAAGMLSSILIAAGLPVNFEGYVFITANFVCAHGTATISDFKTYSLTANVLILQGTGPCPTGLDQ